MPRNCPWCGKLLEPKYLDLGTSIRYVCSKCGFKIKEFAKPEPKKEEPKPQVIEVKEAEIPAVKQTPAWPFIAGAIILILIIIILVKIFLV
ncbi:MAG: hypothetical protein N3G19_01695 [Candidatus Pacearchaeota archaeon]|nr:hypothetical protein [Candidatus Pacearchaeota archaeon]